jgi:hypothetical protein
MRLLLGQELSGFDSCLDRVITFFDGSFDFAFLMQRPWLRGSLIVLLSLFGTVLCLTSCVMAWRALTPARRRKEAIS